MDLNKAMIIGRLTRDPEIRTTPSGQTVANFGVATSYKWKDTNGAMQEKTEFHNIVAWRKLADICAQYLTKGKQVYIEGRLQTRDWTGQDGIKRYRTEIIADDMIMLGSPKTDGQNYSPAPAQPVAQNAQEAPVAAPAQDGQVSEEEIKVEDIPF